MKKLVAGLITLLMIMSLCTFLTGCSASYEGTYVLESVTNIDGAVTKKFVAGETYDGVTLNVDATILKVKKDKTWYLEIQMPQLNMSDISTGTWEVVDGKLILTDEVKETLKVTQESGKLTFDNGTDGISNKFVLKKSNDTYKEKTIGDLYVGKYNFVSADITISGKTTSLKAGESLASIPITEDMVQLEIKADKTYTMTMSLMGVSEQESGTWAVEGKKMIVTANGTQEKTELIRVNGKLFSSDTENIEGTEMKMDLLLKPAN